MEQVLLPKRAKPGPGIEADIFGGSRRWGQSEIEGEWERRLIDEGMGGVGYKEMWFMVEGQEIELLRRHGGRLWFTRS